MTHVLGDRPIGKHPLAVDDGARLWARQLRESAAALQDFAGDLEIAGRDNKGVEDAFLKVASSLRAQATELRTLASRWSVGG